MLLSKRLLYLLKNFQGYGVEQDNQTAIRHLKQAADRGMHITFLMSLRFFCF